MPENRDFERHFTQGDLEEVFDGAFSLPEGFLFGVANSAYQTEGGLNGPGEPLNNWWEAERKGKVERSGCGIRFWTDFQQDIDLAAGIGLNAFRMGVEWARVQPTTRPDSRDAPQFDRASIEHYSDMVAAMMRAGLEPMVTLHHFTHPAWLGPDFWLENEKLVYFERFVEEIATVVNTLLIEKHGLRPVRLWITINEPLVVPVAQYLITRFPGASFGIRKVGRAWSNIIDAHCRAYDIIHRLYRDRGWDEPLVTYNTACMAIYFHDKVTADLINARLNGVPRDGLPSYLRQSREAWDEEIARCPEVWNVRRIARLLERAVVKGTDILFRLEDFETAIDAVYGSPEPKKMDFIAIDFYDPFFRHMLKLPTLSDIVENRFNLNYENWEWVLNPRAFYHFLRAESINSAGLPVMIVENGMAYKVFKGRVERRRDGATRDVFLQTHLFEAMRALKDGVPLTGYLHWTLVDNYEWGSYDPRYGLYSVDRTGGGARRLTVDAWGVDAGAAYRAIIAALRSGDRESIFEAFTKDYT